MSPTIAASDRNLLEEDQAKRWRWLLMSLFLFSDSLNFLDRQLLAALAPAIKGEFRLSNQEYGWVLSAFAAVYMLFAPLAGLIVDRVGIRRSMFVGVTLWSLAGTASGLVGSLRGLVLSRMALGVAETVSVPSGSKAVATYLPQSEFGFGIAANSFAFTVGAISAPLIGAYCLTHYDWRTAFLLCGFIGLLWVPVWWFASRTFEQREIRAAGGSSFKKLISDTRLWRLAGANVLIMALHSLWFNWTTIYFVDVHHLTLVHANQYFAWIPPIAGTLGGFFGGWLAFRRITRGSEAFGVRLRIARIAAPLLLVTAILPFVQSTILAVGIISLGFFLVMVILSNVHVLPLHLFGVEHAAFTASILALSYALLQMVFSPMVGAVVDRFGFSSICIAIAPLPLIGVAMLQTIHATPTPPQRE